MAEYRNVEQPISTIGLNPVNAAPSPAPRKAVSEMGYYERNGRIDLSLYLVPDSVVSLRRQLAFA